jgi:hypothetical protein
MMIRPRAGRPPAAVTEQEASPMDPDKARALASHLRRIERSIDDLRDELDDVRTQLKKATKEKPAPPPDDDDDE